MRGPDQPPKPTRDPDPRSRPVIQTDPDLTIQTDPNLTIQTMIQTRLFYVGWTFSEKYYSVLQSTTPVLLCTTKYCSVPQSTMLGDLVNFAKIWPSRCRPRSRPFQTSSMESKGSVHSQPCCPRRKNRSVRPVQKDKATYRIISVSKM